MDLSNEHRLQVADGNPEVCGFAGVVPYSFLYGVEIRSNVFEPNPGGSETFQTFKLDTFTAASPRSACYCPNYDQQVPFIIPPPPIRRLADGTCNDPIEFYQPIGPIVTRGPALSQPRCVMDEICDVTVPGIDLSIQDKLQICPYGHSCGEVALCPPAGPQAATGLQTPVAATSGAASFALGAVPMGLYELCYCAPGNASGPSAIPCDAPADLTMQAVLLRVRGVRPEQRLSCVVDKACRLEVQGLDVSSSDKLQLAPLKSVCGNATFAEEGLFLPSSNLNGTPGTSNLEQAFDLFNSTRVGRYKICYCIEVNCTTVEDYYLDAGVLFVIGIQPRYHAARCTLGERCNFEIKGMGLVQGLDTVQLVPTYLGCGGSQVIVSGAGQAGRLNGIYDRGETLFETRPWYQGRLGNQYLFYDLYSYRWVLGPERNPDVPETAGWAWVEDLFTQDTTPDRVQGSWQVWDQQAAWIDQPDLDVGRVTAPAEEVEENPCNTTTDWVPDPEIDFPFLVSERFELGVTSKLTSYLICYCPALDADDKDELTCSGDDEFLVPNGMLLIEVVRGNERHHCEPYGPCVVRTVLPELMRGIALRVLLLPADGRCNEGPFNTSAAWEAAMNVTGRLLGTEATFELGDASVVGSFQVCLCTGYDDSVDGVPCSEPQEFYQQIGTLTVMPTARLSFEFGEEATLNLTRGLGLNYTDTLRFVEADSCTPTAAAALTMQPDAFSSSGDWAAYVLGRLNTTLPRGSYTACLCTAWDGGDAGTAPCDDSSEFAAKVAVVTVDVVSKPELTSSVTSAVELQVQVEPNGEARRLSSMSSTLSPSLESVLSFAFASAIAEALRSAITAVLGASPSAVSVPAELVDIVIFNASIPLSVGLTAGFVAKMTGTVEQHLNPTLDENVSCPISLLNAPWNNTGNVPEPTQAELQDCLWIGDLFDDGSTALVAALSGQLRGVVVPGIVNVSVRQVLYGDLAPALAWEPLPSACVRGVPCDVPVTSSEPLLSGGAVLLLDGEDTLCGSLPPPRGVANASDRAAAGFEENPALAPVLVPPASRQRVLLQEPANAGVFALCYCWPPAASPSSCGLDWDFYQRAGTLTVRGAQHGLEYPCISFTRCTFTIPGTGLTAWDRVMLIPWASECGYSALALDRVEHNPAPADRVVGFTNGTDFRRYQLGMITRIGKYRICYCASYAQSAAIAGLPAMGPCAYAGDFSMTAGALWARGVDSSAFRFSCVKDDINTTLCALMLAGQGLLPGADAVLLIPPSGASCGRVPGELADVFDPNPIVVEEGGPMLPWHEGQATSAARWRVRAKRLGTYRVCFCPVSIGGSCSSTADFFHQAGVLTVRGAQGQEIFICRADDVCFIQVHGLGLSMRDKVKIINGDQFCDWGGPGSSLVELNPAVAVEVSDDLGMAEFALGVVQSSSVRVVEPQPVTLRVCYCASNNLDGEGAPCSSGADFTHSAGVINTVVCPRPPGMANFNPPVQDVFGDLGDPHIRLFSIPAYTCEDDESRTLEDLLLFSTQLDRRGHTVFNESRVLVTRDGQCAPNVPAGAPLMNMMASRSCEIRVLGALQNSGSMRRGGDVRIRLAHHLRGQVSVVDIRGQGHVCPFWEVNIVPLACDAGAATLFGLLLHGVILLSSAIFVFSNKLGAIVRFIKDLRAAFGLAGAAPETMPRPGMPKAGQAGLTASPSSPKGTFPLTGTLKSTSRSGQQLEEENWDGRGLASVLSSSWWASVIAGMRVAVILAHLVSFMAFGRLPDALMLLGIPLVIVIFVLFLQFLVLARAAGLRGACAAILCPRPYVPPSALGRTPEPGVWRFALPPLLHSAAAVLKLHLDLALPLIAQRHHCELWRVAFLLLAWILLVQVVCPLFSLLFNFMSPRRQIPAAVIPLALTVFGTLAGDAPMLGPEPLGLEPAAKLENDSDVDSVASWGSSRQSIWSAGSRGLRRLTQRLGLSSKSSRSKSPIGSNQPTPKGSKEPAAAARGLRPVMNVRGEEDVAGRKEKERTLSLRKAAKQAMAERVAKGRRSAARSLVQSVPETGELQPAQDNVEPEEQDAGCCWPCSALQDAIFARFGWLSWASMVVASPAAPALVEEMHRHRAVGLYAFMEASGWHVATAAAREVVERVSGVCVAHMQGRWTMLYSLFGGLDLTAIHAFVAIAYAPRLSAVEITVLVLAILVGLFQASRPGTLQALLWLIELCINGPRSFVVALGALAFLRVAGATPLSWGCPRFTWGFTAWACSILLLEVPLFLLWRRYHSLPWNELRTRALEAIILFFRALPGRLALCCCCCCCRRGTSAKVAEAEVTSKEAPLALALADAKPSKIAQVVPTPEFPEAEPVLTALKKLVDTLPEGLRMVLEEEEDGDIRIIREVVQDLFKLPPPKYDLEVRAEKLARIDPLLRSLALKLDDEDKHCRRAYNEVLRLADEKLYRLRLAVDAVRLVRSIHFRLGSLENRAELAFEVLPDAPQMWLVHWATLLSLGRLPGPEETECMVLAEEVAREFPGDVVLIPVIHKPRCEGNADPHSVTCRQLVTFAKWYRGKWGLNFEIFYWLDCCCFPEIEEATADAAREKDAGSDRVSRLSSKRSSTGSSAWSLPTSRNSSKSNYSDYSMGTRFSSLTRYSRVSGGSRRSSRLSLNGGVTIRATVKKRGLKNLSAAMEDDDDSGSARSGNSGLASINFRDRKSIIGGLSESAGALTMKGRSSSKVRSTNYRTLADLQRMKRDKDMGRSSSKPRSSKMDNPLYRLGLETTDVNGDMLRDGSDLVRLLAFAAADAVVVCEAHDDEDSAWVRMGLALAYAFSPTGQQVYAVDRSLVHVPGALKASAKPQEAAASALSASSPPLSIPKHPPPIADAVFPGAAPLEEERGSDGRSYLGPHAAVSIISPAPLPPDFCVWRELIPDFIERVVVNRQDHYLADPTDWGEVHMANPREDRPRIVRLTSLSLDRPTILSVGAYRRPPLEFGKSIVHICRLEVRDRARHQWRRALRKQKLAGQVEKAIGKMQPSKVPESSSSSGEDDDDLTHKDDGDDAYRESDVPTKFRHTRPILDLVEQSYEHYYKSKKAVGEEPAPKVKEKPASAQQAKSESPERKKDSAATDLLRRAADMRNRWGIDSAPHQMLHPLPSLKKLERTVDYFHPTFHSRNVLIGSSQRTAEQYRPKDTVTGTQQAGNPGLAILSTPLKVRGAVCPDKHKARGVSFDLKVEATNAGWRDGLGIGFTAQDPDQWPADKLLPRNAMLLPRTCMCGYSGRWVLGGRSELVHSLNPGQGAWEPGSVRVGDVVTAVFAAPPADVIRILVNGRLVAERPALSSGLPDPAEEPLWGLVELDGACAKVRLGAADAPRFASDLAELASRGRNGQ